jgi:hypothetical protein
MFKRSSRRRCETGACVEVDLAWADPRRGPAVAVRDSKAGPSGAVLVVDPAEWRRFIAGLKADRG